MKRTSILRLVSSLAGTLLVAACGGGDAEEAAQTPPAAAAAMAPMPAEGEPTLDQVRAATDRFRDVEVALAEGYIRDPFDICETSDMMGLPVEAGAMGIHYFRPDLLGVTEPPNPRVAGTGTNIDFLTPSVLLYEPQADGSLELVGVENLAFEVGWRDAGNTEPPSFYGVPFDHMADDPATELDEAHNFEPHFDRHVWLYRENPNGIFTPFNPSVSCQHHTGATHPAGADAHTSH